MMIGMGLFWLAVILGLAWLVRDGFAHRQQQSEETALTILDRRFAKGTVSIDDQQRRDVLTDTALPHTSPDTTESGRSQR
jgi:hypothetical protein